MQRWGRNYSTIGRPSGPEDSRKQGQSHDSFGVPCIVGKGRPRFGIFDRCRAGLDSFLEMAWVIEEANERHGSVTDRRRVAGTARCATGAFGCGVARS